MRLFGSTTLIILALLLIAAYVTNPNEEDFKEYVATKLVKEINPKSKDIPFESYQIKAAEGLLSLGTETHRKDYTFCSVFTVDDFMGNRRKYIGLFTVFIPLN